ncbi:MAG: glycogen synthase GlgA [bacterium]
MVGKKYRVLFASSEVAPFAKTGGLADVAGALPSALSRMGYDVRIFTPKYGMIDDRSFGLRRLEGIDLSIPIGGRNERGSLKWCNLPDSDVVVYFLEHEGFYGRSDRPQALYGDPTTGEDYEDNAARFAFYCRGALEFLKAMDWRPDLIHCNDWEAGPIPLYLKTIYRSDPFFSGVKTLYSIHNFGYQGLFEDVDGTLGALGLGRDLFYPMGPLEFWGKVNFMKAGIVHSDILNTVSKTYAKEVQTSDEFGRGLQGVLADRSDDFYGVVNGIDYSVWNPEIDDLIPAKYGSDDLSGKRKCKVSLLRKCRLPVPRGDVPLIGMISRLDDQKGFDIVTEAADEMMGRSLQFVLLGTGAEKYHRFFEGLAERYPRKVSVHLTFDDKLAHEIEAGADMFLMPSRYEPCGLNQLYSLKYGTVPIVRRTGGLADTIRDFDPSAVERGGDWGNGFVFEEYSAQALLGAVGRALEAYKNKRVWTELVRSGMREDFSWDASAREYVKLYEKALSKGS